MSNQTSDAQKSSAWIKRFDGPILHKQVAFGSPLVRHQFNRSFEHVGRNVHMVSVFGRVLLGENQINEAEDAIYKRIEETKTAISRKAGVMDVVLKDRGVEAEELATFNRPVGMQADIVVPAQTKFLEVLAIADRYAQCFNTLWLHGHIVDKEKSKLELELKKLIRAIPSTTRKMRDFVKAKLDQSEHEDAKKEASAMLVGVEDERDDDDDSPSAEALLKGAHAGGKKSKPADAPAAAPTEQGASEPVAAAA